MILIGYDAKMTDGSNPEVVEAIYLDNGQEVRIKQIDMVTLEFSLPSVAVNVPATLTLRGRGQHELVFTQDGEETVVNVDLSSGVEEVVIDSPYAGKITATLRNHPCVAAVLEVV